MPAEHRTLWGWHCLTDDWARRVVAGAGIRRGALVLDIGAGTGALTSLLVEAGARVVAFELHPGRAAWLREHFAGAPVRVVQADVGDLRLPRRPFHVVASPPFAQTSSVLRRLLSPGSQLVTAQIVLQRDAARRWERGEVGGGGRWERRYWLEVPMLVPRSAFVPRPNVDAAVLAVSRRVTAGRRSP